MRLCESCGAKSPPFVPRKRMEDGSLVCGACADGRPGGGHTQAVRQPGNWIDRTEAVRTWRKPPPAVSQPRPPRPLPECIGGLGDSKEDWSKGWARTAPHGDGPSVWGEYVTGDGTVVRAYRGAGNKVRFYDAQGTQHGPEQSNVAPAVAYAISQGWYEPDSVRNRWGSRVAVSSSGWRPDMNGSVTTYRDTHGDRGEGYVTPLFGVETTQMGASEVPSGYRWAVYDYDEPGRGPHHVGEALTEVEAQFAADEAMSGGQMTLLGTLQAVAAPRNIKVAEVRNWHVSHQRVLLAYIEHEDTIHPVGGVIFDSEHLVSVAVLEPYRGKGIARLLLEHADREAGRTLPDDGYRTTKGSGLIERLNRPKGKFVKTVSESDAMRPFQGLFWAFMFGDPDDPDLKKITMRKGSPFAGYDSWADCIQQNQDADDPEAYCGKIKHETEGSRTASRIQLTARDAAAFEVEMRRHAIDWEQVRNNPTCPTCEEPIPGGGPCPECGPVGGYPDDHSQGWTEGYRAAREGQTSPPPGQSQAYLIGWQEGQDRYRMEHGASLQRHAHDSGDGATIYHCPFDGSGQVTARSDGSAWCEFCRNSFTVQVQPEHNSMPQTQDGQRLDMPNMPGEPPEPDWERPVQTEIPEQFATDPNEQVPDEKQPGQQVAFRTREGHVLAREAYLARLALRTAPNKAATLAKVRGLR